MAASHSSPQAAMELPPSVETAAFFGLLRNKKDPTFPGSEYYKVVVQLLQFPRRFLLGLAFTYYSLLPTLEQKRVG